MKKQILLSVLFFFFLSSCATARLTQFNTTRPSGKAFNHLLISVDDTDLSMKVDLEKIIRKKMAKNFSAQWKLWHELFPPLKTYTDKELWQTISREGIDALLVFTLKGSDSQTYMTLMPTWVTSYGRTTGSVNGEDVRLRTTTTHEVYTPYFYQAKIEKWEVSLMEVRSKEKIWLAAIDVRSSNDAASRSSLASQVVKALKAQGYLSPR